MSAVEFEQLASEIRPAWEVGLDAVGEGSAIVAAVPTNGAVTAGAFSAPAGNMASMLGALGGPSLKATFTGVMPVEMPVSPVREQPLPSVMISADASSGVGVGASPETTAALPLARPSASPAATSGPLASTPPGAAAPWEKTGRFAAVGGQSLAPSRPAPSGGGLPLWLVGVAVVGLLVAVMGGGMMLRGHVNPDEGAHEQPAPDTSAAASASSQEIPSAAVLPVPTPLPELSAMPTAPVMVPTAEPSVPAIPTVDPMMLAPAATATPEPTVAALPVIPPPVPSVPAVASAQEPVAPPTPPTPPVPTARPSAVAQQPAIARPTAAERPATPRPPRVQRPPRRPSGVGFTTESPY